jgi:hypothetical protein
MSDWGLHRVHLTTNVEKDGFVERTGDLLFCAFTEEDAYLIGIYPHGSWALRELVEILVREWPENAAVNVSISGFTPAYQVSEQDHLKARQGARRNLARCRRPDRDAGPGNDDGGNSSPRDHASERNLLGAD